MLKHIFNRSRIIALLVLTTLYSTNTMSQDMQATKSNDINYLEILLIITAVVFVFVIWLLSQVLVTISKSILKKRKGDIIMKSIMVILLTSVLSSVANSQTNQMSTGLSGNNTYGGMQSLDFYALATVISLELLVILFLSFMVRRGFRELSGQADIVVQKEKQPSKLTNIWSIIDKKWMTRAVPIEHEADILLDHDYDGIRELDNALPPWWKYGFYFTIVVAIIYILNFHVWGIGKNPEQEYAAEMQEGKRIEEIYKAKTKDLVDENNIMLADAAGIEAGKSIFLQSCIACHGTKGEGGIGPNLTDEYWIHGGGLNNIYKTIKIGYPEKGMQSWQSMFSPIQIKNLSSFVKSIKGTNPPNGKAPQGDIYKDESSIVKDTIGMNSTSTAK